MTHPPELVARVGDAIKTAFGTPCLPDSPSLTWESVAIAALNAAAEWARGQGIYKVELRSDGKRKRWWIVGPTPISECHEVEANAIDAARDLSAAYAAGAASRVIDYPNLQEFLDLDSTHPHTPEFFNALRRELRAMLGGEEVRA